MQQQDPAYAKAEQHLNGLQIKHQQAYEGIQKQREKDAAELKKDIKADEKKRSKHLQDLVDAVSTM